jgi:hypothetical protein
MARDKMLVKRDQYVVHLFLFINTALYVRLLMRANPLLGQMGGGWALEILTFFGTCLTARCHFTGPKKVSISRAKPPPACPRNGFSRIKTITYGAV